MIKVAAVVVSLVGMASVGGGFVVLPLLIPVYVWAGRRSGLAGQLGWCLLAAIAVGMATWAGVYVTVSEETPEIWLVPLLAFFATGGLMWSNLTPADAPTTD